MDSNLRVYNMSRRIKLRRRTIGGSPGSWLTAKNKPGNFAFKEKKNHFSALPYKTKMTNFTHAAEHFGRMTSAAAAAHTGPAPHAQRDCEVSPRGIKMPPPPQTELSETTPGNTGRAAGWQRNGTLLLGRRQGGSYFSKKTASTPAGLNSISVQSSVHL